MTSRSSTSTATDPASCSPTPTASTTRSAATTSSAPTGRAASAGDASRRRARDQYFREYPFAWFGILCEAPPSAPELIYNHSERGFALISQRTETLQRMYFQCDPDDRRRRLVRRPHLGGAPGPASAPTATPCSEGPITSRTVLPFRSFVQEPMRHGNLLLAGDAAHTVPPTGAKGLNLALADVRVLAEELERAIAKHDASPLDDYSDARAGPGLEGAALLLLDDDDAAPPARRQRPSTYAARSASSPRSSTRAPGSTYLAEAYTGWPHS